MSERLSQVQKVLFGKKVDFVLHTPGNYRGGILEMTIVLDHALEKNYIKEMTQDIIAACKMHSPVFRNVRLNVVDWAAEDHVDSQVIPMPVLQMGSYFDDWDKVGIDEKLCVIESHEDNENFNEVSCNEKNKKIDLLLGYLKKYHARSKLVVVLTTDTILMESHSKVMENLSPFLKKKIIIVQPQKMMDGKDFISLKTPIDSL